MLNNTIDPTEQHHCENNKSLIDPQSSYSILKTQTPKSSFECQHRIPKCHPKHPKKLDKPKLTKALRK
jgi:hypothetical protein